MLTVRRALLIPTLWTLLLAAPALTQPNAIRNGSMDAGEDVPTGWESTWFPTDSARLRPYRDTGAFHSGPASLCLSTDGGEGTGNVSQQIGNAPGSTFRVSGFARKSAGLQHASVFVRSMFENGQGEHTTVYVVKEADTWEAFDEEVRVPAQFNRAIIGIQLTGNGKAWLDDLQVTRVQHEAEVIDLSQFEGDLPKVTHVCAVAPDVLAITVQAREVTLGRLESYQPQEGDEIRTNDQGTRSLIRNRQNVGMLVGERDEYLMTRDRVTGQPLQVAEADKSANYTILSADHEAYADGLHPVAVFRKSKATNDSPERHFPQEHHLYLKLPHPLVVGNHYDVRTENINLDTVSIPYHQDPTNVRSEAVHATHIGFRPDDPAKVAFLSLWMGTGGGYTEYPEGLGFALIGEKTGGRVFAGEVRVLKPVDEVSPGLHAKGRNFNATDVREMDFSSFTAPGTYRVCVDGIGCSYPFVIAEDAWEQAFRVAARGFYHQRSGIALEQPYTDWTRPRGFHPDDGKVVYETSFRLNEAQGQDDVFTKLVENRTEKTLDNAWGGYFDAGDWDRRIHHLSATRKKLELLELFPEYLKSLNLNIPESANALPDVLDECLWNIDCYRRMQTTEGGVRGGIESEAHPKEGETSWTDSLLLMAFAPDFNSSWIYAGVAARAAHWMENNGFAEQAGPYRNSAVRAMEWAEADFARLNADGRLEREQGFWQSRDERNLAALELYRLTGDGKWHDLFIETCGFVEEGTLFQWGHHVQRDAGFLYVRLAEDLADRQVRENAVGGLIADAEAQLAFGQETGFRWVVGDAGAPLGIGNLGAPQCDQLLRAHALTGDAEYLSAAILAAQYNAGANPLNMCLTSGVGPNPVRNLLVVDARRTGRTAPPGITVYGPMDFAFFPVPAWVTQWKLIPYVNITQPIDEWPLTEAYFDIYSWPLMCEYTIHQSLGPTVYVWGYLAARA